MQYYRLWIYSCNSVLGVTSAIFTIFAAFVLADVRLSLLGGIELYHPTFLYAYAALILQCGVVQTIGCLGAQRLNHKLLSVYWILLLLLTIGDVVVGLVWVYKLDKVKLSFKQTVLNEFKQKYSIDASFTSSWNKVQAQEHCCGVEEPSDFNQLLFSEPNLGQGNGNDSNILFLPDSCCTFIYTSEDQINQFNTYGQDQRYASKKENKTRDPPPIGMPYNLTGNGAVFDASLLQSLISASNISGIRSSSTTSSRTNIINSVISNGKSRRSLTTGSITNLTSGPLVEPKPAFASNIATTMNKPPVTKLRHSSHLHNRRKLQQQGVVGSGENQTMAGGTNKTNSTNTTPIVQESTTTQAPPKVTKKIPMSCQNHDDNHSRLHNSRHGTTRSERNINENPIENNARNPSDRLILTQSSQDMNQSVLFPFSVVEGSLSEPHPDLRVYRNYRVYYNRGCRLQLTEWLDYVSGIMFILGFCIIGFIKACFLVILRREIREMIEKIQLLESESSLSPSRNHSCSSRHDLRDSGKRMSCGGAVGSSAITANLSGIVTIKSPQGDGGSRLSRHDRSTSHSQETVNMTLLITTPKAASTNDPKPLSGRELNRSSFCDDSTDNDYYADAEHEDDQNVLIPIPNTILMTSTTTSTNKTSSAARPMKENSFSSGSSVTVHGKNKRFLHHNSSENNSDICELLIASVDVENCVYEDEAGGGGADNWKQGNKISYNEPGMAETYRRNGNNNIKTSNSFTLALLGTAV